MGTHALLGLDVPVDHIAMVEPSDSGGDLVEAAYDIGFLPSSVRRSSSSVDHGLTLASFVNM